MNVLRMLGTSLLLLVIVCPVVAQDAEPGGVIIQDGRLTSALTINPILSGDVQTSRITGFLFPGFLNVNVAEGVFSAYDPPYAIGGIVDTWEVDETGTVYTFHLREGLTWSDGDPIDAADVLYTWRVIQAGANGEVSTPLSFVIDPTGQSGMVDVRHWMITRCRSRSLRLSVRCLVMPAFSVRCLHMCSPPIQRSSRTRRKS